MNPKKGDRIISLRLLSSHLGEDIPVESIGTIMAIHRNDTQQFTTYVVRFDIGKDAHIARSTFRIANPLDEALA